MTNIFFFIKYFKKYFWKIFFLFEKIFWNYFSGKNNLEISIWEIVISEKHFVQNVFRIWEFPNRENAHFWGPDF